MKKTRLLPKEKVWIGSPLIATFRRIFEQTVTYREWQEPLLYADDEPHIMRAWNPLSEDDH